MLMVEQRGGGVPVRDCPGGGESHMRQKHGGQGEPSRVWVVKGPNLGKRGRKDIIQKKEEASKIHLKILGVRWWAWSELRW